MHISIYDYVAVRLDCVKCLTNSLSVLKEWAELYLCRKSKNAVNKGVGFFSLQFKAPISNLDA